MNLPVSKSFLTRLVAVMLLALGYLPAGAADLPKDIAINVMDHLSSSSLHISATSGTVRLSSNRESVLIDAGQLIQISVRNGQIEAKSGSRVIQGSRLEFQSDQRTALVLNFGTESRAYAGALEISQAAGNLKIVNRVPLEDYIASVVGSEYGFKDLEGSKAMAVVARTFALRAIQSGKPLYDNERSQVYRGLSHATSVALQAAQETAGQVLEYNGQLIEAVYSASNGGYTASNASIWGSSQLPYLRAKKDPWDTSSPHATWEWSVSEAQLFGALSSAFGMSVRDIKFANSGADGRVGSIELRSSNNAKTVTGNAFRAAISRQFGSKALRSTYFSSSERRGTYTFSGRGFGHGVGLSQWGAHFMSGDGRSYAQILDFYYSSASIKRLPSSGGLDQSLIEIPVLSSGSSYSASASSASLSDVLGDDLAVKTSSSPARNMWDTLTKVVSEGSSKSQKPLRRSGW
ncbi:MAG: SpoIID/LytB domain-containing protein [Bacteroidetes bacterium]|nr:SpoIID/LytB domain-containing protein [Bacteroidota bacterium]